MLGGVVIADLIDAPNYTGEKDRNWKKRTNCAKK